MKYSVAAIACLLAVAQAQLPDVPTCSQTCFLNVLSTDGCSSILDFKCHCAKVGLVKKIQPCVESKCSKDDQAAVIKAVSATCAGVGEPLTDLPSAGGAAPPPSSPPPSSSKPAPAPATSAPAPSKPASSEAAPAPATTDAAPSAPASSESAPESTTETATSSSTLAVVASTVSALPTGGATGSTGSNTTTSGSPVPFTGTAAKLGGSSIGAVVAMALAAVYLL